MAPRRDRELWVTADGKSHFLVPNCFEFRLGRLAIKTLNGESASVDPSSMNPMEVTEAEARTWAKEELSQSLNELREAVDEKLAAWRAKLDAFSKTPVNEKTTLTPDAVTSLFDLISKFPGVLGKSLSGDESGAGKARDTMADLQRRFKDSGIDLDERFTNFPERLADLRREFEKERVDKRATKNR